VKTQTLEPPVAHSWVQTGVRRSNNAMPSSSSSSSVASFDDDFAPEIEAFMADMTFAHFHLFIGFSHELFRTYKSSLFDTVWTTVKVLPTLRQDDDADDALLLVFHSLVDLVEKSQEAFGFGALNDVPYAFIEDVRNQARSLLGRTHTTTYKLTLLLIYHSLDVHPEVSRLLKCESNLDNLLRFPRAVVSPIEGDRIRGIRYWYVLGVVYTEAGWLDDARESLLRGLKASSRAEHDDGYLEARGDYAKDDLLLCRARILKALARVCLKRNHAEMALAYFKRARTLEWVRREDLLLPEEYTLYLESVDSARHVRELHLPSDHDHDEFPAHYFDGLVLYVEARASVVQGEDGLWLIEQGIAFFSRKSDKVNEPLQDQYRNLLILKRLRFKTEAIPAANWLARLDAHLEFVRDLGQEEQESTLLLSVLKQAVHIMWLAVKDGGACLEHLHVLRDSASFVLDQYRDPVHLPDEIEELHAVGADAYQVLADTHYCLGDVAHYLKYAYVSKYVRLLIALPEVVVESAGNNNNEVRLNNVLTKVNAALVEQNTVESQQVSEVLFTLERGLSALLAKQPPQERGEVPRLSVLTRFGGLETCHLYIRRFHLLLRGAELTDALALLPVP